MGIVGIAIIRRAKRHNGLEARRSQRGDLQGVEPAPGNADHADGAAAPGLLAQPFDYVKRIQMFPLAVFVGKDAVGVPGPANVDADRSVAMPGVIAVHWLVPQTHEVALAIRKVFEDGYPYIFDLIDVVRKFLDDVHG